MKFSISVVSHASGKHMQFLLDDFEKFLPQNAEVILTINAPENEFYLEKIYNFSLKIIRNDHNYGFGENHNRAFKHARGQYFVIANPDIRLIDSPFEELSGSFDNKTGVCAPRILSPQKTLEDSVRRFPTTLRLLQRVILNRRSPDYHLADTNVRDVDWVAGMFVMFDAAAFRKIGGFDTNYFMYMEDSDICRRMWNHGLKVRVVCRAQVIHDAQRASRHSWQHKRWHLRSAIRFLFGF